MRKFIQMISEASTEDLLFHGTSLVQFVAMRDADFRVEELYVGDSRENITDHYADNQAEADSSYPVTLYLDRSKLAGARDDVHPSMDGGEHQLGQFIFNGDLRPALIRAVAYDFDTDQEVELPLEGEAMPLPLKY